MKRFNMIFLGNLSATEKLALAEFYRLLEENLNKHFGPQKLDSLMNPQSLEGSEVKPGL